jgi:hypothetical protein
MQYAESTADLFGPDDQMALGTTFTDLQINPGAEIPGDMIMGGDGDEPEEESPTTAPQSDPPPGVPENVNAETGEIIEAEAVDTPAAPEPEPEDEWATVGAETPQEATTEIAKPEDSFAPGGGPFKDKPVEEILKSKEGRAWLVQAYGVLRTDEKRDQLLRWLSWHCKRAITAENLDSVK